MSLNRGTVHGLINTTKTNKIVICFSILCTFTSHEGITLVSWFFNQNGYSMRSHSNKKISSLIWFLHQIWKRKKTPKNDHAFLNPHGIVSSRPRNGPSGLMDRPGPGWPDPAQQDFSVGSGGPVHKSCWAGQATFFVGPTRPDVSMLFFLLFIKLYTCHKW
jgi:hypothetical protein